MRRGIVVSVAGLAIASALASCGGNGSSASSGSRQISVDVKYTGQTAVGQDEEVKVVVKNVGSAAIGQLILTGLMGPFKQHNVVTNYTCDPMGCQENTDFTGFGDVLDVGKLDAGQTVTIDLVAAAKDAGNFKYSISLLDTGDGTDSVNLTEADGQPYTYNVPETVTPAA